MLGRLILLLLLVALVYGMVRRHQRRMTMQDTPASLPATEDMVRCVQCGIHLPRSEGVLSAQKIFCCVEHRDAYRR